MVRDIRIKELFISGTFDTATTTNIFGDYVINGEIIQVDWAFNRTGSIALTVSGTGEEIFRRNAPSGAGVQVTQPRVFTESTTGSIAGAEHVPFIANDKLSLDVTGAASGTQSLLVHVRYR